MNREEQKPDEGGRVNAVEAAVEASVELDRLFRDYHAMVFRTAFRVTGNAADAEDVMQTVFLRLLRRGEAGTEMDGPEQYLRRSAVNGALDVIRARTSASTTPLEAQAPLASQSAASAPERLAASGEIRSWLRAAVARLSPQAAEIFALRFFEGHENGEIARIVGTTPATVSVTLSRARDRIEQEFRIWQGTR